MITPNILHKVYILSFSISICFLAVVKMCETQLTPAGADGIIITHPSVIGTQQRNCELNLTDLAPNSWIRFKMDIEARILERLCGSNLSVVNCPGIVDNSACTDGVVICYIPRERSFPQIIIITAPKGLINSEGLTMSYKG